MRIALQAIGALAALVACTTALPAQDLMPWQPNLETAQRLAAQSNRLVLIHFWAPWCRPCLRIENDVFSNPETAKGLEANFVMVKINADELPSIVRTYGVSSLPADVIATPSGQLVAQYQSPPSSSQYVAQMNQSAAGHRSLARKPDAGPPAQIPTIAPANAGAATAPADAGTSATVATASVPPGDRYAEYFPRQQAAEQASSQVMPAQATAPPSAAPVATSATVANTRSPATPYAPGSTLPYVPAAPSAAPADRYAAVPADRYAVPSATAAPADPYAVPPAHDPYAAGAAPPAPPADPYAAAGPADPYAVSPAVAQAPPSVPPAASPNPYAPPAAGANPYAAGDAANPYAAGPYQPAAPAPYPQAGPQLPPGCPPLGLDGNCPVTLVERKRWVVGHQSFGAVHRGRTYLFLGPQEKEKFLADPDRFAPVLSGIDPVQAFDHQATVPGKREFGVFGADGHIYLFADEASRTRFEQNEQHYTARAVQATQGPQYQAMRQGQ